MNARTRFSIRGKLAAVMVLVLGVLAGSAWVYFPEKLKQQATAAVAEKAAAVTEMTAFSLGPGLAAGDQSRIAEAMLGVRRNADLAYFLVFDNRGVEVASFNDLVAAEVYPSTRMSPIRGGVRVPHATAPAMDGNSEIMGGFSSDNRVYQSAAVVRLRGRAVGRIVIGLSLDGLRAEIDDTRATVAVVTILAFILGVAAVFGLGSLVTGPLQRIVETAEEIADGHLDRRADVKPGDEVGQLASSFNMMVDRLAAAQYELEILNHTLEQRVDDSTVELRGEIEVRARAEAALRDSEERYRLLFERNLAGVYIASVDEQILACNDACARLLRYDSREQFLAEAGAVTFMDEGDHQDVLRRLEADGVVTNQEVLLRGRADAPVWALMNVRMNRGGHGDPPTLEGILLDVSDRKMAEDEIAFKAYHDSLTGLPNRALILDRLEIGLAEAERRGSHLAVMFLDLDEMKTINDTLGHSTGDELLKQLGDCLADTVGASDSVARVGGDEFVILLPEITSEADAERMALRVLDRVSQSFVIRDDEIQVTTSIGVAIYPADGTNAETLLRNADGTMYRVKESGGNGFELCSRVGSRSLGRLSLEKELRMALERDEFLVYYQPLVLASDRSLVGMEALVRWNHPDRGIVEPSGFITVAEQTGLITAMGEIVFRKAALQTVEWQKLGLTPPRLSVNVSARQFYQRDFAGMIKRVLAETGLESSMLELEITESVAVQRTERSLEMLRFLRGLGLTIAMDDFGTGQSSLSYLKRFPLDCVKIDRSFVRDMKGQSSDDSIVTAVLVLAKQLGLRSVAEGVEDEEQFALLKERGCLEIQGFLISRPLPAETFGERFLMAGVRK
jgi:diguanylate cyclase (GGDEF)-like protein/PAS domain S-box-containing protein